MCMSLRATTNLIVVRRCKRIRSCERTLVSVEASVAESEVVWWNEALLGANAAAEPAERKRTAVESFIV